MAIALRLFKFSYDTFMIHYTGSHCFTLPVVGHGQMKQCVFSSDLFFYLASQLDAKLKNIFNNYVST